MIVEMRLEAGDCIIFGDFNDGCIHAESRKGYASEGGTCFLKLS